MAGACARTCVERLTLVEGVKRSGRVLTKPFSDDVLLAAIRARSRAATRPGSGVRPGKTETGYGSLSPRESTGNDARCIGRLNKQVGSDLGISEVTVKAHRTVAG